MLPNTARISTDLGMLQLVDAPRHGRIYTGKSLAEYDLVTGIAHVQQVLLLSNGQLFACAQTTPLVRYVDGQCTPTSAQDLAVGDVVCGSCAVPVHYPKPLGCPEDAYWLGFFAGVGSSCPHKAFAEFETYCATRQEAAVGSLDAKILTLFETYGVPWAFSLRSRRVPKALWSASLADRQHYCRGVLVSYGHSGEDDALLSLHAEDLGQDLLLLLHTMGVYARLPDPRKLWVPKPAPVGCMPPHVQRLPGQPHLVGHSILATQKQPVNVPIASVVLRGASYGKSFDCSGILVCSHR
jgi:hypothetical protein